VDSEVKTRITPLSEINQPEQAEDCLVIIYSPDEGNFGKRQLLSSPMRIGRERGNQIVLQSDSVSRRHCLIDQRQTTWYIKDLGSTNGTYVNDQLIEEYQLRRGDQVKVGDTIFKYLSGSDVEAQYHETIYRMTIMDGLTNVHNKRYLIEALEREISRAGRHERPLALLLFDLDHFKQVNDTYGHIAGDYVLKEVAAVAKSRLRPDDILARYGGEEFAVVLPETELMGGVAIAEQLRQLIKDHPFEFEGERIPVSASIGAAQLAPGHDPMNLIKAADVKLYDAKRSGRDRVCS
jgi:diguanylate cyclase (GGDEF)-like protein